MRVAVCGTSNSGKTTLIKRLENKHPDWTVIHEIASTFDKRIRNTSNVQRMILEKQIDVEREARGHMILLDRCVFDNLIYCWIASPELSFDDCLCLINKHMRTKPYDLIIFVNEFFPLVDNGLRDMDPVAQRQVFSLMSFAIPIMCNAYNIPLMRVVGHSDIRIRAIEARLRELQSYDP